MSAVGDLADRYGFVAACRPDVDESRWALRSETHTVFVVAPHELFRFEGNARLLAEFQADLSTAREWLEEGSGSRIVREGRIEIRPHAGFELAGLLGAQAEQDAWVSLTRDEAQDLHDPDSWPVLDEEPES